MPGEQKGIDYFFATILLMFYFFNLHFELNGQNFV